MSKKQKYYTLRKDYVIKVKKWNKIFKDYWKDPSAKNIYSQIL